MRSGFSKRSKWIGCVALLCVSAQAARKPVTAWDRAVAMRAGLDEASATRAQWNQVLDEFRIIYHDNPADVHAPDAVMAVAELLADEGRLLGDVKLSRAALGQYEFLRTQYPASSLRAQALLAEGRLDQQLGDQAAAKKAYAGVVKEAPASEPAGVARGLLAELNRAPAAPRVVGSRGSGLPQAVRPGLAGVDSTLAADPRDPIDAPVPVARPLALSAVAAVPSASPVKALAEVSGIRHWSTPTYTRVAIDLGDEVKFEAARVPHPDRIYFDLHGARLAAELVGKSFDVTDDGFLRKIRAAQASGDVTRVVLDVSDVSEYSAFLLPNPYRLIIDIHGGKKTAAAAAPVMDAAEVPVPVGAGRAASAAANSSGLPAMAPTDGGLQPVSPARETARDRSGSANPGRPAVSADAAPAPRTGAVTRATLARPVPNTVAVKAPSTATEVAAVSAAPGRVEATSAPTSRPIVAVMPLTAPRLPASTPARAADKTAEGETSLVRALGLKVGRIVIDAGHGGHDSGTLGVDGIQEKDVVLDVALRLGKLLHERLGAEIIYTRADDTFIPLETRTAIANKAQADLFLSIHANSSQDASARGVETYYLNFTSDPTALDVAARENAVGGAGVHQLSDLVKKIALKDKIAESREFASDVEASLYTGLEKGNAGLKNRGVKKAPFVVLIGANMPSILAEISFVTNERDATQLREPEYRQRVAESLFNGVAKYEGGLAGSRPAPVTRAAVR